MPPDRQRRGVVLLLGVGGRLVTGTYSVAVTVGLCDTHAPIGARVTEQALGFTIASSKIRGPAMWLLRWLRAGLLIFKATRFVIEEDDVAGLVWLMIGLGVLWWWYGR